MSARNEDRHFQAKAVEREGDAEALIDPQVMVGQHLNQFFPYRSPKLRGRPVTCSRGRRQSGND
jgi:hypothetical protein